TYLNQSNVVTIINEKRINIMTKKKVSIDHLNLNEAQKREFLKLVLSKVEGGRLKPMQVNRLKSKYENQL
ncbi:hypothetical protein CGH58_25765, partial [Vibrio parahaemolyticus]